MDDQKQPGWNAQMRQPETRLSWISHSRHGALSHMVTGFSAPYIDRLLAVADIWSCLASPGASHSTRIV